MSMTTNGVERTDSNGSTSSSSSSNSISECEGEGGNNVINATDVLLGRGGMTNSHIGNKNFRYVVAEYQQEYLNARKKEKKEIAKQIVARIQAKGGRFLKQTASAEVWTEVTDKKAIEKTSQALREGLDVRHRTVRPEKLIHRLESDDQNPRKRGRLVKGLVMESPKMTSVPSTSNDIPELSEEGAFESPTSGFEPLFTFHPLGTDQPDDLQDDRDKILEI